MCYNISIFSSRTVIESRVAAKFEDPSLYRPQYHASGFTAPKWPVITNEAPGTILFLGWGLVPRWIKDVSSADRIRFRTLNARSETIHEKPSFGDSLQHRRCLVIVDGFFEWRTFNKRKYPYFIRLTDDKPFALAGIWDAWVNRETTITEKTFSIATCAANRLMERIHNVRKRMPVILDKEAEALWLNEDSSLSQVRAALKPFDDKKMQAHSVSRLISARGKATNVPEATARFHYPELEPL